MLRAMPKKGQPRPRDRADRRVAATGRPRGGRAPKEAWCPATSCESPGITAPRAGGRTSGRAAGGRSHTQSIAMHTGPLAAAAASYWAAVFEAGDRGMSRRRLGARSPAVWSTTRGRRSASPCREACWPGAPPGSTSARPAGWWPRTSRRRASRGRARGRRRTRGGCGRARDKQATLLLTMTVQQGLTTPRPPRYTAPADQARPASDRFSPPSSPTSLGGVRSLGEREFAQMCRRSGAARTDPPGRQARSRAAGGTSTCAGSPGASWWRSTASTTSGRRTSWPTRCGTTRSPWTAPSSSACRSSAYGVAPDEFFAQIIAALVERGCRLDVASSRISGSHRAFS